MTNSASLIQTSLPISTGDQTVPWWRANLAWIAVLAAIVLGGAILRGHALVDRPFWEDESYTWKDSQLPYWRLVWWKYGPHQGPLGYMLVRHAAQITGSQEPWALRLPSFLAGVLCIPAAFWLGRTVRGPGLGVLAAALVAVDPNMVDQSQQARMYTLLALAWMLALGYAIRVLRDPPSERRPWVCLGLLLSSVFYVNFGAVALWGGVACAGAWLAFWRPETPRTRDRIVRGLTTSFTLATLVSIRGVYRFIRFVVDDHEQGPSAASDRLRVFGAGVEQLLGEGALAWCAVLLAVAGLALIARQCRTAALLIGATGLIAALMVFQGQSSHDVFAVRYFTVMQPTIWIGLAAFPLLLSWRAVRATSVAAVIAYGATQAWESTQLESWYDFKLWNFVRVASAFIDELRADQDQHACAPQTNLRILARYYGLPVSDKIHGANNILAAAAQRPQAGQQPIWLMAYMSGRHTQAEMHALLTASNRTGHVELDVEKTLELCRRLDHVVLRVDARGVSVWEYVEERRQLRELPVSLCAGLAKRPDPSVPADTILR